MYTKVVTVVEHALYRQHDMEIIFTKNHKDIVVGTEDGHHDSFTLRIDYSFHSLTLTLTPIHCTDSIIIQFNKQSSKRA